MNAPDATSVSIVKSFLCAVEHDTMCLERISAGGTFQAMAAHPDGSPRVFLSSREGNIWLAKMPRQGSGSALSPHLFLDLTDRVHNDHVLGLLGMAFHPEFATNGWFFVSYTCDTSSSPTCGSAGRYQHVVAEYSSHGGGPDYSKATRAAPSEVRRIFTMCLPRAHELYTYKSHVGQILFRPGFSEEYYLYLVTGHGGFSKDGRSLFGKILRFNVGEGGSSNGTREMMDHVTPQIYATGINNPSGCSFDSDSSSRLFCADVNEELAEVVHLLKEGAIGYDGGSNMSSSNATTTVASVVNRGRPKEGVGGIVYRGIADPWLNGRYMYVYTSRIWTLGRRSPLRVGCSKKSPLPCGGGIVGGRVLSMGEDNSNDALFLTARGMFRVVAPGACAVPAADPQPPGTNYWVLFVLGFHMVFGQYLFWTFWSTATGAGEININFFSNVGSLLVINYNRREHQE